MRNINAKLISVLIYLAKAISDNFRLFLKWVCMGGWVCFFLNSKFLFLLGLEPLPINPSIPLISVLILTELANAIPLFKKVGEQCVFFLQLSFLLKIFCSYWDLNLELPINPFVPLPVEVLVVGLWLFLENKVTLFGECAVLFHGSFGRQYL